MLVAVPSLEIFEELIGGTEFKIAESRVFILEAFLTDLLEKVRRKASRMNTLLSAIFKFCTTNQLLYLHLPWLGSVLMRYEMDSLN